jgi:LysM repeat protein
MNGNGRQNHDQLRHELEYSAQQMRAILARRHQSTRLAVIGLSVAGALGALVAVILLVTGTGGSQPGSPQHAERRLTTTQPPMTHPAAPQPSRPTPRPPDAPVHTVERGDTLSRIALHYRTPVEQIAADNRLADPNRIIPGQHLLIRPAPAGVEVIAPGSTLTGYGHRYGLSVTQLLALNPHITDPNRIRAGGRLRVMPGAP